MKTVTHVIADPLGLHARPAGGLAALAKEFESTVSLQTENGPVDVRRLMAVMRLCLHQGDEMTLLVEGADEEAACGALREFCVKNL